MRNENFDKILRKSRIKEDYTSVESLVQNAMESPWVAMSFGKTMFTTIMQEKINEGGYDMRIKFPDKSVNLDYAIEKFDRFIDHVTKFGFWFSCNGQTGQASITEQGNYDDAFVFKFLNAEIWVEEQDTWEDMFDEILEKLGG